MDARGGRGAKKIPAARYSPTGNPRSTLAEETLHCRVRNGNGCCLLSMATGKDLLAQENEMELELGGNARTLRGPRDAGCQQCLVKTAKPHG